MRISDLSRRSGTPVPTIKFYLRERLLPGGMPTARNQAEYHEGHVLRLRTIRALTTIGKLDLATIHELLAAADDRSIDLPELNHAVNESLWKNPGSVADDGTDLDTTIVRRFVSQLNWDVAPDSPALRMLTQVITSMRYLGCDADMSFFRPYAEEAARSAAAEIDLLPPDGAITDRAAAIVRSVLLEATVVALRRLAQESLVASRFQPVPDSAPAPAADQMTKPDGQRRSRDPGIRRTLARRISIRIAR